MVGETEPLEAIISNLVEHMLFSDALVLAESYHANANSEESLHIYVKCLMLLRRYKAVHALLTKTELPSARIRYLYAKSCFEIAQHDDAKTALCEPRVRDRVELHRSFQGTPSSPLAHLLLAQILVETGSTREKAAGNEFRLSVKENPFIYSTIKGFCDVNHSSPEDIARILVDQFNEVKQQFVTQQENSKRLRKASAERPSSAASSTKSSRAKEGVTPLTRSNSSKKAASTPAQPTATMAPRRIPTRQSSALQERDDSKKRTRASTSSARSSNSDMVKQMNIVNASFKNRMKTISSTSTPSVLKSNSKKFGPGNTKKGAPLVASNRQQPEEFIVSPVAVTMPIVIDPSTSFGVRPNDENQIILDDDFGAKPVADWHDERSNLPEKAASEFPIFMDVIDYLTRISVVQRCLSRYESDKAKRSLELGFPPSFQKTSLVLEMQARAAFELGEYKEVVSIMQEYRRRFPFFPNGLEILSTALWHLQDAHALSALAKTVMGDMDDTAEAWCVNGNCFSVQKKHDNAIECLSRATSINPRFAYGYSLLGHELIDIDQTERAIDAFSTALQYSRNDYRAYYGLALVHFKREENGKAQEMLQKAIAINRNSTVLLCQLAKVEQRLGNPEKADRILQRALMMNPDNVAVRYHYAENLFTLQKYNEALEVLRILRQLSPDEPNIYSLIGRVLKKKDNEHLAQLNLNWAQDIDPRGDQHHSVLSERRYGDEETPQRRPGEPATPNFAAVQEVEEVDEQMEDEEASSVSGSVDDSPFGN
uniref:Cell division cycle protein 27 homolog n=1 Tax=Steinernema glaseri TaxID=37863 RepID=A0A1I7Y8A9_9BILA